ncbi:hypothetical protein AGMMS49975_07050 [Clostridia bacterium]|nr:hypothetical protein AGMMS49975_07050 [Clostridia bacterium]
MEEMAKIVYDPNVDGYDNRKVIVVVDDVTVHLMRVRSILQDEYDVRTAKSGSMALNIISKVIPALMLIDIEMPVMSGFELAEKIKGNAKTKNVPIAFLTSHATKDFVQQGVRLGILNYVIKPFDNDDLKNKVHSMLGD